MNVDAYLKRIHYTGSREPTLETLRALCRAHVSTVPYSNYGYHGGPRCELTYEYMYDSIVTRGQGDNCYTCNGAFSWLLKQLGFTIKKGHAKFWLGESYSVLYHHMTPSAIIDGQEWFFDVGWLLYEPLKMEMMKPQVQRHGIFRIREAEEDQWLILERYGKTVLDVDGSVLKQGPDLPGGWNGSLDCAEMKAIDFKLWSPVFMFTTEDQPLSAFEHRHNYFLTDKSSLIQSMLVCHMFTKDGMFRMFKEEFAAKKHINPITDQIVEIKKDIKTDEEAETLTEKYSGIKLDFKLKFYTKKDGKQKC